MRVNSYIEKLKKIETDILNSSDIHLLKKNYPDFFNTTLFVSLLSVPKIIISQYPYIFYQIREYKKLFIQASEDKDLSFHKFYETKNILVKSFIKKSVTDSELESAFDKINFVLDHVCEKYPFDLILEKKINKNKPNAHIEVDSNNLSRININFEKKEHIIGLFAHEYGHLIEVNNKKINKECLEFLKNRSLSENKIKMKDFCQKYSLELDKNISSLEIVEGFFIDSYIGFYYGENYKGYTEVFSMGLQLFFIDPISFLFKDREHFEIIYKNINNGDL